MSFELWISFAALNFICALPPGQNAAVIMAASARKGVAGGASALAGVVLAEAFWAGLALLAVAGVVDAGALDPDGLQLVAALVLLLLGLSMLVKRQPAPASLGPALVAGVPGTARGGFAMQNRRTPRSTFALATMVGLTNPLTLVFFASAAPLFLAGIEITPGQGALFILAALLSCAAAHAPYMATAGFGRGRAAVLLEGACGAFMCLLGAGGALTASGMLA